MLFHVSEQPGIELFEPRWSEQANRTVVWAIDADHLHNYLVPRDCPRVTYYAGPQTARADVERFLATSHAVVAIESGSFEQLRSCHLYCYHLPPDTFECIDTCAGYFVSNLAVVPARVEALLEHTFQTGAIKTCLHKSHSSWKSRVCDLLNITPYESTDNYEPLNLHSGHIYLCCQYRRARRQSF